MARGRCRRTTKASWNSGWGTSRRSASLAVERMLFVCDWRKTQTRLREIARNPDKRSFFFAIDIFVKHFLEHGHNDGPLGLTMNFNSEEGPASLVPTFLAAKDQPRLMWDGIAPSLDDLVEGRVKTTPQARSSTTVSAVRRLSSLLTITAPPTSSGGCQSPRMGAALRTSQTAAMVTRTCQPDVASNIRNGNALLTIVRS